MNHTLDIAVQDTAHQELAAVEAGYGPLHDEIAAYLGRQSVAASDIESRQVVIEAENTNAEFVRSFARELPHTRDGYVFEITSDNPQYEARQIQANTIWLYGNYPYY